MAGHFTDETFDFLFDLDVNNDRAWFDANRERFETHVRGPMLAFISDLQGPLKELAPRFVADPSRTGGSMFRIHRDTRFSNDKRPYKTHAAAQFRHEWGRDVHAPGYYLHLEPGNCFVGAGMWRPDNATLTKLRQAIVDRPGAWTRVVNQLDEAGYPLTEDDDRLKRAPRGFDPDHRHIDDLRRTSFVTGRAIDDTEVAGDGFVDAFVEHCRGMTTLVRHQCRALDLPF